MLYANLKMGAINSHFFSLANVLYSNDVGCNYKLLILMFQFFNCSSKVTLLRRGLYKLVNYLET